jgi:hypothetical protein
MMEIDLKKFSIVIAVCLTFTACSSKQEYVKPPTDRLITQLDDVANYSIVLQDMNVEGDWSPDYFHKYKIIKQIDSTNFVESETDWLQVDEREFQRHIDDLGMEVVSKHDGKISKTVAPAGYTNYVGNPQYGEWRTDNTGNSFWAFYGQYAFLSTMLGMRGNSIYRNNYMTYRRDYYGRRPYYGRTTSGSPRYGTFSSHTRTSHPTFHNRLSSSNTFRDRVRSSVSRSSSSYGNRSSYLGSKSRSSGSGYRSRSGGFGK